MQYSDSMNVLSNILRFILTLLRDAIADLLRNIFFRLGALVITLVTQIRKGHLFA